MDKSIWLSKNKDLTEAWKKAAAASLQCQGSGSQPHLGGRAWASTFLRSCVGDSMCGQHGEALRQDAATGENITP